LGSKGWAIHQHSSSSNKYRKGPGSASGVGDVRSMRITIDMANRSMKVRDKSGKEATLFTDLPQTCYFGVSGWHANCTSTVRVAGGDGPILLLGEKPMQS